MNRNTRFPETNLELNCFYATNDVWVTGVKNSDKSRNVWNFFKLLFEKIKNCNIDF